MLLGLGLVSWSVGDLILTANPNAPSPGLQDAFYLGFYPVTYVGLMLMMRRQVKRFNVATWLDGAIAGVGAAAICAAFAFHGVLNNAGGGVLAVATNLAYPIGELCCWRWWSGPPSSRVANRPVAADRRGLLAERMGDTFNLFSLDRLDPRRTVGSTLWRGLRRSCSFPARCGCGPRQIPARPRALTPGYLLPGPATRRPRRPVRRDDAASAPSALGLAIATLLVAGISSALSPEPAWLPRTGTARRSPMS